MNVTVRERTGDDPVVVVGISLGLHQRHATPGGASLEIGVFRILFVEGLDDLLGLQRHLMRGAVAEVDHLFGVADGPVAALLLVAGVGAGGGVSEPQRLGHFIRDALDGSREATIPDAHELSVPVLSWQPQLHVDQGVGRRLESHLNAAVGRDVRRWRAASRELWCRLGRSTLDWRGFASADSATGAACAACSCSARRRRTFGHDNRAGNGGIGELQGSQTLARCCSGGGGEEQERAACHGASSNLGSYNRTLSGTWADGATKGDFTLTRD